MNDILHSVGFNDPSALTAKKAQYYTAGRLAVEVHHNRRLMGAAAGNAASVAIRNAIEMRGAARVIFACAPSQDEFLENLIAAAERPESKVDWTKVVGFHMDDYLGLSGNHPQSFRSYIRKNLLSKIGLGIFHEIPAEESDPEAICKNYGKLLAEAPIDLICLGIGENGHIAFNDPPVANFEDSSLVKIVQLDEACRRQQVNDGCFAELKDVPREAVTLTVPVFRQADCLSIHVPGRRKAAAVRATFHGPISTACPASILRNHPNATLYLDQDSARLLKL